MNTFFTIEANEKVTPNEFVKLEIVIIISYKI